MIERRRLRRTTGERGQTRPRSADRGGHRGAGARPAGSGQVLIEFAIVSVFFFLVVFGTIDFGRAIFLQSELENAVREATRELKTRTASVNTCSSITQAFAQYRVRTIRNPEDGGGCGVGEYPRPGLETATATISCTGSCSTGDKLTVTGYLNFQAVTQNLLGISPLTLSATSTVTLE